MSRHILAIDDEAQMLDLITACLNSTDFQVTGISDPAKASGMIRQKTYDLVLLDIMMPKKSGWELLEEIRRLPDSPPVIMLTALGETNQVVRGLHEGADDYITKPFEPSELAARMDAVLRRGSMKREKMTAYEANGVEVDTASRTVKADGREVVLTKKEFDLLACLIRSPGQVFTRDQLLDAAAAAGEERLDRSIDAHIKNIREKMKAVAPEKTVIETIWGVGYRLPEKEESSA
ncbi:response regulator transcription factor [Alkalicoccus saliphilus]|uniref:DNA-binding response regulator n=1 Tax=Alkalicoccus saliphilus TaxID=200989 RepID=A0A2T4U5P5_9BACI|nr:response regulator transcription factor [Alkalicoccus saliphilus]PTL38726.1 DNA-binding response regulator [Alkalicoccus saliphilus]